MKSVVADTRTIAPEIAGTGTYTWHVQEDELEWSAGLLAIYGLESPPAVEVSFYELLHPEDRLRVESETASFLEQSTHYSHEFRIIRPDGSVRHILDRAVIERGPAGQPLAVRGLNVDITEQRALQPEIGFRALADNINQLAWIADGAGWIHWYNARWFEYTGTTLEEMAGWGWRKVHHPDHVDRVVAHISRCFQTGEEWEDTFPLRGADGSYRWFLSRARPVHDADGSIRSWFGTNTDITEQREADERAKEMRRAYEALANSMPQLVWTAEASGRVLYYNQRIDQYWVPREPESGDFEWSAFVHPDDLERTWAEWRRAAEGNVEFSCDHRLRLADGSYRWHLSRALPVPDDKTGQVFWYGTATDIEDMKRGEGHRQLLLQELNHRIKNTLSLVHSIASQSFREGVERRTALDSFGARLQALGRAHDLLIREDWHEVTIAEIVDNTLGAMGIRPERIAATGDDVRLSGRIGVMLAMGVHELATNSIKYGALSVPDGRLTLEWSSAGEDPEPQFRFVWQEVDGPPVVPPTRSGFGTRLMTRALSDAISGEARLDYAPEGLRCVVQGNCTA